jgi:hypothetical protein
MSKKPDIKKKRPRALRKTEIGVDVVSIEKFKKHKRPELIKMGKLFVAYCDDPDFPDTLFPQDFEYLGQDIRIVIIPKGARIDDYEISGLWEDFK